MNARQFADPGPAYRGVALWMLNDRLEPDELERQFRGFRDAGWGAVITRTFPGLRTEYLSDEWMAITRRVVDLAGELDAKVWLQAGYMPSGIPDLPPQDRHRVIIRKEREETTEMDEALLFEAGRWAYYARGMEHVLDLLSPEPCADYMQAAYSGTWGEHFGDDFGKAVESVWVDEPHFRPPLMPWTPALPERFRERWGYDLVENLPSLFDEEGDYRKVRHHYWRTVLELFLAAYFTQVRDWCAENGVKFSGHLMGEDTFCRQIGWTAACMPCYEYMQLPGIDHLTGSLRWPADRSFILTPKQCSSASNQLGRREVLAEMYGVSSQGISFEGRKLIAQWLMMLGINYRCYHAAFYSMRGRRKRIYIPHLSHQQPWWPENRLLADYGARLSYALRQGQYRADVLVMHSIESGFCIYDAKDIKNAHDASYAPENIRQLEDSIILLSENLLRAHRGFEYGDETLIARHGSVADGFFRIGRMSYRAVVLPSLITLRRTTLDLLLAFIDAGGRVLSVGDLPSRIDGVEDADIERLNGAVVSVANDAGALADKLDELVPTDVRLVAMCGDAAHVWLHERRLDDARMFILANMTPDETVELELSVAGVGGAFERWDMRTGEVTPVAPSGDAEGATVKLSLPPVASHLLVLREGAATIAAGAEPAVVRTVPIDGSYGIATDSPNGLMLDFCRIRKGDGEWSESMPVLAVQEELAEEEYAGLVTLQFRFVAEAVPPRAQVVVEDAGECDIRVNGQAVAYAGLPYYWDRSFLPVDITPHVREGENLIEISRPFQTPPKSKFALGSLFSTASGVELEAVYLIGDFGVRSSVSPRGERPGCVRLVPEFTLTERAAATGGDLVADGYPFFAGRLTLERDVDLSAPAGGERVHLVLPGPGAALSKVCVNGRDAGAVAWAPYEVDVTDLVRDGANRIEIELVTSLRNLLGPHHHPEGEPADSRHHHFCYRGHAPWSQDPENAFTDWTGDYFVLPLGFDGEVRIEYRS